MHLFRWRAGGRAIEHFGSRAFTHFRLARAKGGAALSALQLGPGGVVGRHPAAAAQLFVVVEGSGEVSGGDGAFQPIAAGEAVAWDHGEEHETRSTSGLLAIVLEGEAVEPVDVSQRNTS
jgi:mannose-6-phosphate isomerase-like protein (cupin superfamily)